MWVDYEDGLVAWKMDKRRLKNWVLRGGEKPPNCEEVVSSYLEVFLVIWRSLSKVGPLGITNLLLSLVFNHTGFFPSFRPL